MRKKVIMIIFLVIITGCVGDDTKEGIMEVSDMGYDGETGEFSIKIESSTSDNMPDERDITVKTYERICGEQDDMISKRTISEDRIETTVYTYQFNPELVDYVKVVEGPVELSLSEEIGENVKVEYNSDKEC
jgi:hypothetical protein